MFVSICQPANRNPPCDNRRRGLRVLCLWNASAVLPGCPQINRRIVFVCYDFSENSADLETGRILTGRSVVAFDRFVDAFESANFERHLAGKFFELHL